MQDTKETDQRQDLSPTQIIEAEELVRSIGRLFQTAPGHLVPDALLKHPLLRGKNGKVNFPAVHVLARVLYWYRPRQDGGRKFYRDWLQKKYVLSPILSLMAVSLSTVIPHTGSLAVLPGSLVLLSFIFSGIFFVS